MSIVFSIVWTLIHTELPLLLSISKLTWNKRRLSLWHNHLYEREQCWMLLIFRRAACDFEGYIVSFLTRHCIITDFFDSYLDGQPSFFCICANTKPRSRCPNHGSLQQLGAVTCSVLLHMSTRLVLTEHEDAWMSHPSTAPKALSMLATSSRYFQCQTLETLSITLQPSTGRSCNWRLSSKHAAKQLSFMLILGTPEV